MAFVAIPAFGLPTETVVVAEGSDFLSLSVSFGQALAAAALQAAFLIDLQLTGGGAGALWQATLVLTSEPLEVTPPLPVITSRFRVVIAPTRETLRAQIRRAVDELVTVDGCQWIAKIVEAGAGSGAVYAAIVLGSVSSRPVPGQGPQGPQGPQGAAGAQNVTRTTILGGGIVADAGVPVVLPGPVHTSLTGNVVMWADVQLTWATPTPSTTGTLNVSVAAGPPLTGIFPRQLVYTVDALGVFVPPLPSLSIMLFANGLGLGPVAYPLSVSGLGIPPGAGNSWSIAAASYVIADVSP